MQRSCLYSILLQSSPAQISYSGLILIEMKWELPLYKHCSVLVLSLPLMLQVTCGHSSLVACPKLLNLFFNHFSDCCNGLYQLGLQDWRSATANTRCHQCFPPSATDPRQKVSIDIESIIYFWNNKSFCYINMLHFICFWFYPMCWTVFAVKVLLCLSMYSKPFENFSVSAIVHI